MNFLLDLLQQYLPVVDSRIDESVARRGCWPEGCDVRLGSSDVRLVL